MNRQPRHRPGYRNGERAMLLRLGLTIAAVVAASVLVLELGAPGDLLRHPMAITTAPPGSR